VHKNVKKSSARICLVFRYSGEHRILQLAG
jgi:hypothetical protein